MLEPKVNPDNINQEKIVNEIRALGIDMIDAAQSGHPGIVLDAAPILYTLYANHLNIDPEHPDYFNRDRFIMSCGHGSALLYSTLYMAGYKLTLADLKNFRQIDSITPGHPEYGVTPGVDMTTGPLGQGLATAVGIAMAEANLRSKYTSKVVNFNTYVLCSDGDLMEGISYEAASLAGTLNLHKLIVLYDSNNISLDGPTNLTFTDNIKMRFEAFNWNYLRVDDGEDLNALNRALNDAKSANKPTLIEVKTIIGKYSELQGTNTVHGKPLTKADITHIKKQLKIRDIPFTISKKAVNEMQYLINNRCNNLNQKYLKLIEDLDENTKNDLTYLMNKDKTISLKDLDYAAPESLQESPRDTSSKVLNSLVKSNNGLIGGAADLFAANKTYITAGEVFSKDNYLGKNIYFGVREHAMGAILNGLALVGFRPYGSTFLAFSDYLRGSLRLSCLMNLPITYIFTHDSISVGEDGPTHEPIEQLASLRATPNLTLYRPADANEVIGAYKAIYESSTGPSVIALSRNTLPILSTTSVPNVAKGAYIVYEPLHKPTGIIISAGEELHSAIMVSKILATKGYALRVVSMPSLKLFKEQKPKYQEEILPVEIRKVVIACEASISWYPLVFDPKYLITLDEFGASGKKDAVYKKYKFDIDSLTERVENLLK
jgi:transketolase